MENETQSQNTTKTLGSIARFFQQTQSQVNPNSNVGFHIQLAFRYPDLSIWENLDYDTIRSLAEFSDVTSKIFDETWAERSQVVGEYQQRRQRMLRPSRTA